ncbi:MAG TPA: acyl-CoA dehydrogenase [Jiangellaceae bacterium]|nr:acyl-CoA dehydrogenase [Jiangellaceae bacterium]
MALLDYRTHHRAWYLEHDRMKPARSKALTAAVNDLCAALRPHALTLVDALDIREPLIAAAMLEPRDGQPR